MKKYLFGAALAALPLFALAVPYGYGDGIRFNMGTSNPIHLGSGNDAFLGYLLRLGATDNVAREVDGERTSSLFGGAKLNAGLRRDTGKNLYWFGAGVHASAHSRTSQADYVDSNALIAAAFNRGGLNRFRFELSTKYGHEALGESRISGTDSSDIDRWRHSRLRANYHFGRGSTPLALDFFAEGARRDYLNNENDTDILEYGRNDYGVVFNASYSAKTKFVLGARFADVRYDEQQIANLRDSSIRRYFIGIKWLATAKTSGEIRVGELRREIDSTGADETDVSWRVLIDWAPKTYSKFRLASDVRLDESIFSQTAYVRNNTTTLSWTHKWSQGWSSNVFGRYRETTYQGVTTARADDIYQVGFGITRRIGRKAAITPNIDYAVKDSSVDSFDYKRVDVGVALKVDF